MNLTAENTTEENETEEIKETVPYIPEGMSIGGFRLVLDDIVFLDNENCGAFSIKYVNGTVFDKLLICERQSKYWTSPEGYRYRIFVVKLAPGYSGAETWADVRIYG